MAFYALMTARNEGDAWLGSSLRWLSTFTALGGRTFVYDDLSDDNTVQVASINGAEVCHRRPGEPSFLEHEGAFRTAALRRLEHHCSPEDGDWILVHDADEFLVTRPGLPGVLPTGVIPRLIELAEQHEMLSVRIPIHTVWSVERNEKGEYVNPETRVDGTWTTINEPRLWKWRPGAVFDDKPMGCRNEPAYARERVLEQDVLQMLHYGMALPEVRARKYHRYTREVGDHGHNPRHIESFLDDHPPTTPWPGVDPRPKRGTL